MSTFREIISELELAISRNELSNSPNVSWRKLIEQLNGVRANEIERQFSRGKTISPAWLSTMGLMEVLLTDAMDDPQYYQGCKNTGRIYMPEVIPLLLDDNLGPRGIHVISSPDYRNRYYYLGLDSIIRREKLADHYDPESHYYMSNLTTLYMKPFIPWVNAQLVLNNPLEGYIYDMSFKKSGSLILPDDYTDAVTYQVDSGQVTHDGVLYSAGETFVAVETTFTGNGKVKLYETRRRANLDDRYPIDSDMKSVLIRRIMLEHYGVELQTPVDETNNGRSGSSEQERIPRVQDPQQRS